MLTLIQTVERGLILIRKVKCEVLDTGCYRLIANYDVNNNIHASTDLFEY